MTNPAARAMAAPSTIAVASYWNMFCVGGSYALTSLQFELPRLLDISGEWSFAPFAAVCMGLALGLGTCALSLEILGARSTVANGTLVWGLGLLGVGYALQVLHFSLLLLFSAIGGIGVGWTYLAIILMVSQAFPNQPVVRSAIGPLGFSSGAGTCLALREYLGFGSMSENLFGRTVQQAGIICLVVGIVTLLGLPNDHQIKPAAIQKSEPKKLRGKTTLSILLFFNALPGMTVFAGLLPLASAHGRDVPNELPYNMAALALGGLLAQPLASTLQPRLTFTILFSIRGTLLLSYAYSPDTTRATLTLSAILFSHGAGFGILPGLVKRQQSESLAFSSSYGQILVAWGLAGVAGSWLCSIFVSAPDGDLTLSSVIGVIALLFAGFLQIFAGNAYFE